jgi:hypothetical protein
LTELRSAEYDAFGPWVLPVAREADVPRAFQSYAFDFELSDFVLKLPRDIARRDATPSMHLYDRVLVVDASGLTVLVRDGDSFSVAEIHADAIVAVEDGNELLDGLLVVFGADGTRIEVPYNATSKVVIAAVAVRLIELAGAAGGATITSPTLDLMALGAADVAIVNAYRDVSKSGFDLYAAYGQSRPTSKESLISRVVKGRASVSAAVVCGNDRQLVVFARRKWVAYRGKPDLSARSIAIVRSRITAVESSAHPLLNDTTVVTMQAGAATIEFVVPQNSGALAALS